MNFLENEYKMLAQQSDLILSQMHVGIVCVSKHMLRVVSKNYILEKSWPFIMIINSAGRFSVMKEMINYSRRVMSDERIMKG